MSPAAMNYFFEYYKVPETEETKDVLSMKGEAYFFRAYWHFYLLTRFGSIPVMDRFWDGNATVGGLQIPPRDRSAGRRFFLRDDKPGRNKVTLPAALNVEQKQGIGVNRSLRRVLVFSLRTVS